MYNTSVVCLSGKAGSGKTTIAVRLARALAWTSGVKPTVSIGATTIGIADEIKYEYAHKHKITLSEIELLKRSDRVIGGATVRQGLIDLGRKRREQNPTYWLDQWLATLEAIAKTQKDIKPFIDVLGDSRFWVMVPDVRFPDELEWFAKNFSNVYYVYVECDNPVQGTENIGKLQADPSEQLNYNSIINTVAKLNGDNLNRVFTIYNDIKGLHELERKVNNLCSRILAVTNTCNEGNINNAETSKEGSAVKV